jgi:hypothetical protein
VSDCTVCNDPGPCRKAGLFRPIVGQGQECRIEGDDRAAFLYKTLLRLAEQQGVDISELMGGAL